MNPISLSRIVTLILIHVLLLAEPSLSLAQETSARGDFIAWAKSSATPIRTVEGDLNYDDLRPLTRSIGPAHVVALGEPAHGMHEPLAFRNRLFEFLVQEMGFTGIATESSFTDSRAIADFISGKSEIIPSIGQLPSAENQELLLWIRAYNADSDHAHKLRFYGIDLGLSGLGNGYPSPTPIRTALSYVTEATAEAVAPLRPKLEHYLARLPGPGNKPPLFSIAEHDSLTGLIEDLIGLLERGRPKLIAASSKSAYDWAHRNAIVARQADQVFRVSPADDRPGQIPPEAWKAVEARDAAMADNVLWALDREGPSGRLLFIAHNAHVKSAPTRGGVWDVFEYPPHAVGEYLRESLGQDLVIIGMSAGHNMHSAPTVHEPIESLDDALGAVGTAPFLLDLRRATPFSPAGKWLTAPKTLIANSDSFFVLSPRQSFDIVFYVEKLTPRRAPNPR
ncbi:MAG: erythromycin esterase family protein [Limisphaerales bacterium]